MKKKFLFITTILMIGFFSYSYAQDQKFTFGIGINAGTMSFTNIDKAFTFGVDFKGEYRVAESLGVNASVGYLYELADAHLIPIMVGANYYIGESFYAGVKTGATYFINGLTFFTLSPVIGVQLGKNLDLGLQYNYYARGGGGAPLFLRLGINF